MDWVHILETVGLGGILIIAVATAATYLGKRIIEHSFSEKMERFKAELQVQQAERVENFRAELKAIAFEHETVFASLHAERATVIRELSKLINLMTVAFHKLLAPVKVEGQEEQFIDSCASNESF